MTQPWTLSPCTVKDGPALAANNIPAFHNDPTTAWALLWPKETSLDYLIEQAAMRQPRNLLRDRETMRHQKAVDPSTEGIVGYARWVLPSSGGWTQGSIRWEEAQVPPVSADEEKQFAKQANSAWWSPRSDMMNMDDEIQAAVQRYMAGKKQGYIRKSSTYLPIHLREQCYLLSNTRWLPHIYLHTYYKTRTRVPSHPPHPPRPRNRYIARQKRAAICR